MDYFVCENCEYMYKNEALESDCACMNESDAPEFCPCLKDEEWHTPLTRREKDKLEWQKYLHSNNHIR